MFNLSLSTNCFHWYFWIGGIIECIVCHWFADRCQSVRWTWVMLTVCCIEFWAAIFWRKKSCNCRYYLWNSRNKETLFVCAITKTTTTIYYDVNWVCLLAAAMQQPRKSIRLAMHLFHPLYTRNNNECHHLLNAYLNFSWHLNQNSKQYEPTIAHQLPMLSPLQSLISYTLFPMRHCKYSNQTIKFRYKNAYKDWL